MKIMAMTAGFSTHSRESHPGAGHRSSAQTRAAVAAARERGSITLDEIMLLASGSPVDLDEAMDVSREAGVELVADDAAEDDPWAAIETLAEDGAEAFAGAGRTAPDA